MLSYIFLVKHDVIVPVPSLSRCSLVADFSIYVGVRAGFLGFDDHEIEKPERFCCTRAWFSMLFLALTNWWRQNNDIHVIKTICFCFYSFFSFQFVCQP